MYHWCVALFTKLYSHVTEVLRQSSSKSWVHRHLESVYHARPNPPSFRQSITRGKSSCRCSSDFGNAKGAPKSGMEPDVWRQHKIIRDALAWYPSGHRYLNFCLHNTNIFWIRSTKCLKVDRNFGCIHVLNVHIWCTMQQNTYTFGCLNSWGALEARRNII